MDVRSEIVKLRQTGVGRSEIARRLGVARPTVDYHYLRLDRLMTERVPEPALDRSNVNAAREPIQTRAKVSLLLEAGLSRTEIARRLGITKGTVAYHARRLGAAIDERCARRYDWKIIRAHYEAGHSLAECIDRFGFSRQAWHEAVQRGAIAPRPAAMPIEDLLVAGVYRGRRNLKERLIRAGIMENKCESCGLPEWRNAAITLCLHHGNGDRDDNRLSNLSLLCPNCHSQTDNFAGRNGRGPSPPS